ncbi:membrane protein [Bacteroidia bacterium]|nr:membrane protein [Bacteroidia bacterium]
MNTKRESNIELLRIVAMFMIVVHHYCINSGLTQLFDLNNITFNTILVQFMAFGGKVGVNIFFIISGFFMINSTFIKNKVLKLVLEVLFYSVLVILFLWSLGYLYSIKTIIIDTVVLFIGTDSFIAAYLLVYILSPIINKMLKVLSNKEFLFLLSILLIYFSIFSTFLFMNTWNYFGWAFTCYVVGAWLKLYGNNFNFIKSLKINVLLAFSCLLLIWVSMLVVDFIGVKYGFTAWSWMMGNANKITVFLMAVCMFLFFKNLHIKYNKIINTVAGSCFGVLLIHANSNTMRQWLWKDFLHNTDYFQSPYLWLHMVLSCVGIYLICTLIDICRIKFIETPLFDRLDKRKK